MFSLRYKFSLLALILITLTSAGAFFIARYSLEHHLTQTLKQDLSRGMDHVFQFMVQRHHTLRQTAQILASQPDMRGRFEAADNTDINQPVYRLDNLMGGMLSKHDDVFVLLVDAQGEIIGKSPKSQPLVTDLINTPYFKAANQGIAAPHLLYAKKHILQITSEPIFANSQHQLGLKQGGRFLGSLFVMSVLDNAVLIGLKQQTGFDIVLLHDDGVALNTEMNLRQQPVFLAEFAKFVQKQLQQWQLPTTDQQKIAYPHITTILDDRWLYVVAPMLPMLPSYVLVQSLDKQLAFIHDVELWMILLGGIMVVLTIILGAPLFNQISKAVEILHTGTEQIERESFDFRANIQTRDELASLGEAFNRMMESLEEKEKIRAAMEQIVSKDVAEAMLKQQLNPSDTIPHASILSAEISNFNHYMDKLSAEQLLLFLNNYFTRMNFCIATHNGFIDQYMGDAFMAIFGVPSTRLNSARSAIDAAQDMVEAMTLFNLEMAEPQGWKLGVGIGINTGTLVAGNLGAETRQRYSVIGQSVECANYLQKLSRYYSVPILISHETYTALQTEPDSTQALLACRELDIVQQDIHSMRLRIFEVLPRAQQIPRYEPLLQHFQMARQFMREYNFQSALESLQRVHEDWPEDVPTRLLMARCQRYVKDQRQFAKENPQGAYILQESFV